MSLIDIANHELNLLNRAAMADTNLVSKVSETQLWNQLVHSNDKANGADEASQERSAQDTIQETQPCQTSHQNRRSSHARYDAANLRVYKIVGLLVVARVDVCLDDAAHQERTRGLGTNHHLGAGTEECIYERIEGEGVEAVDRGHVGEVGSEGESHGEIERGHGNGGHHVAAEVRHLVLAHPGQAGNVVGQVPRSWLANLFPFGQTSVGCAHGGRVFEAGLLCQHAAVAHLLGPDPLLQPPLPVVMSNNGGDGTVEDGNVSTGAGRLTALLIGAPHGDGRARGSRAECSVTAEARVDARSAGSGGLVVDQGRRLAGEHAGDGGAGRWARRGGRRGEGVSRCVIVTAIVYSVVVGSVLGGQGLAEGARLRRPVVVGGRVSTVGSHDVGGKTTKPKPTSSILTEESRVVNDLRPKGTGWLPIRGFVVLRCRCCVGQKWTAGGDARRRRTRTTHGATKA